MSLLVESIVSEIASQQQAEKQQQVQKYQELLGIARIELQNHLENIAGLYEALKPFILEEYELTTNNNGRELAVFLKWTIQSDELQLAPIVLNLRKPSGGYYHTPIQVLGREHTFSHIQEAIAQARREFAKWKQDADAQFVHDRQYKFNFHGWSEKEMQTAYDELVARFPARQADFDKWRQGWYEAWAEDIQRDEEHQERLKKEHQAEQEYFSDMVLYFQQRREISERNKAKAEVIQAALDRPFDAWQLTYALVAHVDDEAYVETSNRWVTTGEPDANGYWTTFNGHQIKYFYPVSIEPFTVLPSEKRDGLYKFISRSKYGVDFAAKPGTDEAEVDRQIAMLEFELLPEKPSVPSVLNWSTGEGIERKARLTVYEPDSTDEDHLDF
jgi:hypothetical protein